MRHAVLKGIKQEEEEAEKSSLYGLTTIPSPLCCSQQGGGRGMGNGVKLSLGRRTGFLEGRGEGVLVFVFVAHHPTLFLIVDTTCN